VGDQHADALDRLRGICGAFPEVAERPSHGAPTWFVRGKSAFVTFGGTVTTITRSRRSDWSSCSTSATAD